MTSPFLEDNARAEAGAKIKQLRKARNWTQQRLADEVSRLEGRSGFGLRHLQDIESGKRGTTLRRYALIAQALGVMASQILPIPGPETAKPIPVLLREEGLGEEDIDRIVDFIQYVRTKSQEKR